jgi:lysozyme family protein
MNDTFDSALAYLLGDEGTKYTDNPADSGGPTKFGVTLAMWGKFTSQPVTADDISNLTLFQVKPFYELVFWQPLGCDKLTDPGICIALFDSGVLYGVPQASLMAQQAANLCGGNLICDSILGEESVAFLNGMTREMFLVALYTILMQRIEKVIANDPKDEVFRKGWTERTDRLLTLDTNVVFNIQT